MELSGYGEVTKFVYILVCTVHEVEVKCMIYFISDIHSEHFWL
jgi:hypothetical protein